MMNASHLIPTVDNMKHELLYCIMIPYEDYTLIHLHTHKYTYPYTYIHTETLTHTAFNYMYNQFFEYRFI